MKKHLVGLFLLLGVVLQAQLTPEEALQKVFTTLTLERAQINGDTLALLQRGAWESLSYLNDTANARKEDLQQAVPDYYNFQETRVVIKLINPDNTNEYGVEVQPQYRVNKAAQIELLKPKNPKPVQTWQILYLDKNYLALDMSGIRVFFTHTPPQE